MKHFNYLAIAAALASMTLAGTSEAKTNVIAQASPALAPGSTFAWAPAQGVAYGAPNPAIANEITAQNMRIATEKTLTDRGYRQVQNLTQADLLVTYTIVMVPKREARISGFGCGPRLCRAPASYSVDMNQYTDGTLALDLIERRTGRLVWRVTSEKRITPKDITPEKLGSLLVQMTRSLPPR